MAGFSVIRPAHSLQFVSEQRCRARSKGLFRCRENLSSLDSHGAWLDRYRICGQPLRPVFQANQRKRIPSAHPRNWPIRLVWGNTGGLGCHRHPQFRPATFSADSRVKLRHLDTGTRFEGCRSAGAAIGWRRNRHVCIPGPRALAALNSQTYSVAQGLGA